MLHSQLSFFHTHIGSLWLVWALVITMGAYRYLQVDDMPKNLIKAPVATSQTDQRSQTSVAPPTPAIPVDLKPQPQLPATPLSIAILKPPPISEDLKNIKKHHPTEYPVVKRKLSSHSARIRQSLLLRSPANAQEFFEGDADITFSWRGSEIPVGENSYYLLEVAEDANFKTLTSSHKMKNSIVKDLRLDFRAGIYYWRVKIIGEKNEVVESSAPFHFYYREAPLPLPPPSKVRVGP